MKIKTILYQHRRDFWADFECEGCGHISHNIRGYDDDNFHENVIPTFKCPECDRASKECNADYRPLKTKYPEGFQI